MRARMPVGRHRAHQVNEVHQAAAQQIAQRVGVVRQDQLRHLAARFGNGTGRQLSGKVHGQVSLVLEATLQCRLWRPNPQSRHRHALAAKPCYGQRRSCLTMDKIAMLTEILAQNPNDAFARYGLAMEHANQGDTATALDQFQQLTTAHPDYTAGYQMSAQLLIKAGRDGDARQRLEAGVAAARRTGNALALNEMSAMLDELSA